MRAIIVGIKAWSELLIVPTVLNNNLSGLRQLIGFD
jgi:hypothetical protein